MPYLLIYDTTVLDIGKQNATGGGSEVSQEKCCNLLCTGGHDQDRYYTTRQSEQLYMI